jgi:hypothetical protein
MVNLKIRLTSFLTGFAVAGGLAMYQVRQDVLKGTDFLASQVLPFPNTHSAES